MTKQICPLCDDGADYEIVDDPSGKRFVCPTCTKFFIDLSSETYLSRLPEVTRSEMRKKLSVSAKSSEPDQLFVIREARKDELGGDGHQVARTRMIAEWVSTGGTRSQGQASGDVPS
jgi:hypothetical protein